MRVCVCYSFEIFTVNWRQNLWLMMLHVLIIPHVQTQSNRVCNFYVILLWLMLPRDNFVSRILYFTKAGVTCRPAAVKSCPVLHFSVVIFSGPSGSLMPTLSSVENWVPLKPVLGGVRDVARTHYPSCTDSIKPSLQFLCYFVVLDASEG
jgi:hypothetical protein